MSDDAPDVKSRGGVGAVRTPRGDLESMRLRSVLTTDGSSSV